VEVKTSPMSLPMNY